MASIVAKTVSAVRQLFSEPKLRRKLLLTAFLLLVYRLLAHVPAAGVNREGLQQLFANSQLLGLLDVFQEAHLLTSHSLR